MHSLLKSTLLLLFVFTALVLSCGKKEADTPKPQPTGNPITGNLTVSGITGASVVPDAAGTSFTVTVPAGTNVKALTLSIPLATGASIDPAPGTARDYTNPVIFTVTPAGGGTPLKITVTVVVQAAPKSADKQITAFSFAALSPAVTAAIDQTTRKITATVPADADLTKLVPTLMLSAKATVAPASGVVQNFTNAVNYTVTAEDGSTQVYEVKVEKAVVGSNVPCLCTRIEDVSNANEYLVFEYNTDGRVAKMNATKKFGLFTVSFEYNQNGEVTKTLTPDGFSNELTYTNGKLTSLKLYKNGVLQTGFVNVPNGEFIGRLSLNEKNEILGVDTDKFEYTNGNMTRWENFDGPNKLEDFRFEYDLKNHYLSASKPKGIFGHLYFGLISGDFSSHVGFITTFLNNPVKLTVDNGKSILSGNYNYTYNNKGFPTQVELTSAGVSGGKLKFTYSNCQ